jgi:cellulose biosynthesis protein BcsQ
VGKTTLTANLGAVLAARGHRVLLIDFDPQSSLTLSFYSVQHFIDEIKPPKTIKAWFDSIDGSANVPLASLITHPPAVTKALGGHGELGLIASHFELLQVDLRLITGIPTHAGGGILQIAEEQVRTREYLRQALAHDAFRRYDYVLIDCPPHFNTATQIAMIASDNVLIPARPDYLSSIGFNYLAATLQRLVHDHRMHLTRVCRAQHRASAHRQSSAWSSPWFSSRQATSRSTPPGSGSMPQESAVCRCSSPPFASTTGCSAMPVRPTCRRSGAGAEPGRRRDRPESDRRRTYRQDQSKRRDESDMSVGAAAAKVLKAAATQIGNLPDADIEALIAGDGALLFVPGDLLPAVRTVLRLTDEQRKQLAAKEASVKFVPNSALAKPAKKVAPAKAPAPSADEVRQKLDLVESEDAARAYLDSLPLSAAATKALAKQLDVPLSSKASASEAVEGIIRVVVRSRLSAEAIHRY